MLRANGVKPLLSSSKHKAVKQSVSSSQPMTLGHCGAANTPQLTPGCKCTEPQAQQQHRAARSVQMVLEFSMWSICITMTRKRNSKSAYAYSDWRTTWTWKHLAARPQRMSLAFSQYKSPSETKDTKFSAFLQYWISAD